MSMGRLKKCSDEVTMAVGPTVPGTVVESFSYSDRPIDSPNRAFLHCMP